MYQLRLRLNVQGFGRVLLAVSVEAMDAADIICREHGLRINGVTFQAAPILLECILNCGIRLQPIPANCQIDKRSHIRIHMAFSPCFEQCLNDALAGWASRQRNLQRCLTIEISAK